MRDDGERLQKVLAAAGVASRRVSEQLITAGRVTVNGKVVTELGSRVDPLVDKVAVDGSAVQLDPDKRYVMLNKPTGVVSTMADEKGRRDLREFTAEYPERLFNVGRLDSDTSGLLLLTNDGELAQIAAALLVGHGADHAGRLVEHHVALVGIQLHRAAVDRDLVDQRVDP